MRRPLVALLLGLGLVVLPACDGGGPSGGPADPEDPGDPNDPPPPPPPFDPLVDLRADVDRDGAADVLGSSDEAGEEGWTAARGAVFLANLDDDGERCPASFAGQEEVADDALAACHDAADEALNGADDVLDLAPLATVPWPGAPDDAVGALSVSPPAAAARTRLFRRAGAAFVPVAPGEELPAAALRAGLLLALEGKDVVRDRAVWDGHADVTFSIQRRGDPSTRVSDTVRLRVAPLVLFHHALPADEVVVPALEHVVPDDEDDVAASAAFRDALGPLVAGAGVPKPLRVFPPEGEDVGWPWRDRWMQDLYEPAYASMPAAGGGQHAMRVNLRAANVDSPDAPYTALRRTSRIVYFLRGKDVGVVQQYRRDLPAEMQTLNSMGNTEVIPPHEKDGTAYPLGRILRGRTATFYPDPSQTLLLEAQAVQPPVYVDTSWLHVAHVDEVLAFVPSATSPRGWVLLANDPALARRMLVDLQAAGHGGATLFTGLATRYGAPAEATVDAVLANADVTQRTAAAADHMQAMLDTLRTEVGLGDDDVVPVPFLHQTVGARSAAYQPGTTNLLVLSPSVVVAADPHGPIVEGRDPFKDHLEQALAPHGVTVAWVDEFALLHQFVGSVHCGTNASRAIPAAAWWQSGR